MLQADSFTHITDWWDIIMSPKMPHSSEMVGHAFFAHGEVSLEMTSFQENKCRLRSN